MRRTIEIAVCALLAWLVTLPGAIAQQNPGGTPDSVQLDDDTRLPGRVLTMDEDGLIFQSPFFREPVEIVLSGVQSVSFGKPRGTRVTDYVSITNGDRIGGRLLDMTDQLIRLETRHAGTLEIPSVVVESIVSTGGSSYLLDADFAVHGIESWEVVEGDWNLENGVLLAGGGGRPMMIAYELDYQGPITVNLKMQASSRGSYATLTLFAEEADERADSLMVQLSPHSYNVLVRQQGRYERVGSISVRQLSSDQHDDVTIAWDPQAQTVAVWAGGQKLDELNLPRGVAVPQGKYLALSSRAPQRFRSVRAIPAVVPPLSGSEAAEKPERYVVALHNGDRFSASRVTLEETEYVVETQLAELRLPADKVARIVTPGQNRHVPRRQKGDARVTLGSGRLTMVPISLTVQADSQAQPVLVGESDYLGRLRIERDAVRKIDLNIWK